VSDNNLSLFNFSQFDALCTDVQACTQCSRMCDSQRVLNRSSGEVNSVIMFIAEAPGRLGADDSCIPLHGDKTGHNFEELLKFAGLDRSELFITNAVLCNPKDADGNNSTPSKDEILNCSSWLKKQIETINPQIIVTLGATALAALALIEFHTFTLKASVRTVNSWFGKKLIPLYHPGQRAMLHRSFANQRSDYQFVSDTYRKISTKSTNRSTKSVLKEDILSVVSYILSKQSLTYFALHKLFYLIEYKSFLDFGHRLTNAYIIRQKDGPYCTDLHLNRLKSSIQGLQTQYTSKTSFVLYKEMSTLFDFSDSGANNLSDEAMELIDEVLAKHGAKNNIALKRTVYFTRPMRNMLFYESNYKMNLYNTPINFVNELTLAR